MLQALLNGNHPSNLTPFDLILYHTPHKHPLLLNLFFFFYVFLPSPLHDFFFIHTLSMPHLSSSLMFFSLSFFFFFFNGFFPFFFYPPSPTFLFSSKRWFCWGSNPGPCACKAHVISNYTTKPLSTLSFFSPSLPFLSSYIPFLFSFFLYPFFFPSTLDSFLLTSLL